MDLRRDLPRGLPLREPLSRTARSRTPKHVGLLLENRPEFVIAELGAGSRGGGRRIESHTTRRAARTRRGLQRLPDRPDRREVRAASGRGAGDGGRARPAGAGRRDEPRGGAGFRTHDRSRRGRRRRRPLRHVFTSGTTAGPKGVLRSHGKLTMMGMGAAYMMAGPRRTTSSTAPCRSSTETRRFWRWACRSRCRAGWRWPAASRRRRFLDDVRRHGATLFNYVGSPLAYLMDTPERPDDADNPLRLAFGNEGPRQYLDAFGRRFGCRVVDGYGSSEVGVSIQRGRDDPPGSLGRAGAGVRLLDEDGTSAPRPSSTPRAASQSRRRDRRDRERRAASASSRATRRTTRPRSRRTRGGRYYSGDLAYRDAQGFVYFAGRDVEWLRVDGENFLARPVEDVLHRHPDVFMSPSTPCRTPRPAIA